MKVIELRPPPRVPRKYTWRDDEGPVHPMVDLLLCLAIAGGCIVWLWGAWELGCWVWRVLA